MEGKSHAARDTLVAQLPFLTRAVVPRRVDCHQSQMLKSVSAPNRAHGACPTLMPARSTGSSDVANPDPQFRARGIVVLPSRGHPAAAAAPRHCGPCSNASRRAARSSHAAAGAPAGGSTTEVRS